MPFLQPALTKFGTGQDIYALAGATGAGGIGPTGAPGATGAQGIPGATGATGAPGGSSTPMPPSLDLGATPITTNTGLGGSVVNITPLSGVAVNAGQRYRVSFFANFSANTSFTATQFVQTLIAFNTTSDAIVCTSVPCSLSAIGFSTTIEFRVPATNTQMNFQLRAIGIGGSDSGSISVVSFYITPLGV